MTMDQLTMIDQRQASSVRTSTSGQGEGTEAALKEHKLGRCFGGRQRQAGFAWAAGARQRRPSDMRLAFFCSGSRLSHGNRSSPAASRRRKVRGILLPKRPRVAPMAVVTQWIG